MMQFGKAKRARSNLLLKKELMSTGAIEMG